MEKINSQRRPCITITRHGISRCGAGRGSTDGSVRSLWRGWFAVCRRRGGGCRETVFGNRCRRVYRYGSGRGTGTVWCRWDAFVCTRFYGGRSAARSRHEFKLRASLSPTGGRNYFPSDRNQCCHHSGPLWWKIFPPLPK